MGTNDGIQTNMTLSCDTSFAAWQASLFSCLLHASQVCVTQNQDLVCMALLQIDFALQTIAYNLLLYAATMSPASRLLSLHVHGKLIYQMPCIHTSLHTCPHDLSRVTKTPSCFTMQVWVQGEQ